MAQALSIGPLAKMFSSAPPLNHYNDLTLLGRPTMRGAIVFSGSSHPALVDGICDRLGTKRGIAQLSKFANGETQVQIRSSAHFKAVPRILMSCRYIGARQGCLYRPKRQSQVS